MTPFYCDFLQEWGRLYTTNRKEYVAPHFDSFNFDPDKQRISCKLLFDPKVNYAGVRAIPNKKTLEKWGKSFVGTFKSSRLSFCIDYYRETDCIHHIEIKHKQKRDVLRYKCKEFGSWIEGKGAVYFMDFGSGDIFSPKRNIGFKTNSKFNKHEEINIKFLYGKTDLNGKYKVKRIRPTGPGHTVGVEAKRYWVGVESVQ